MSTPTQLQTGSGAQSTSSAGNQASTTTEYTVRVPNDRNKKFSMMKFSTGTNLDFLKLTNTTVRMERENNLREYKSVYNIDTMPKYGAGSEYGREQKEEARRKKYGIKVKEYKADDQPWQMKVGKGKDAKRFKGVREGTITENTSYYIFMQCADGAFEAFPVEEWYNFQPVVQYKYLNSEEAEEEFSKRDKTMNFFSIMVRKRIKNDPDGQEEEGAQKEEKKSKQKKDKSLILTDMDDWAASSEEEENMDGDEEKESKPKKDKKKDKKTKTRRKNAKINDNDEAVEESDEGDFDDRELDYISDSGSESDLDEKGKEDKYDDKGVDQERGLKKLIDSDEESEEEEEEKKEEEEKEEKETTEKKSKKKTKENKDGNDEDSDSSSSSSESDDSDIDKNEDKFSSVLFMQKKKGGSRPNTPTVDKSDSKTDQKSEGTKRKMESEDATDSQKKPRTESPAPGASIASSGEVTEDSIRRYLLRRPMTAKEIVQKFRGKLPQLSKDQMTQKIGQLLKKINPEKKIVNGTLLLFLSEKKKE